VSRGSSQQQGSKSDVEVDCTFEVGCHDIENVQLEAKPTVSDEGERIKAYSVSYIPAFLRAQPGIVCKIWTEDVN
jgi:hypothetical protein